MEEWGRCFLSYFDIEKRDRFTPPFNQGLDQLTRYPPSCSSETIVVEGAKEKRLIWCPDIVFNEIKETVLEVRPQKPLLKRYVPNATVNIGFARVRNLQILKAIAHIWI